MTYRGVARFPNFLISGDVKSVGVFIGIVYIMQIIWGMYVSWCFHLYCIYHANNLGDVCQLVFN